MKKNKVLQLILLMILCFGCLFWVNRDLFHFTYNFPFTRVFTPEENTKGNYILTEAIPLKTGLYELIFSGSAQFNGSGCYITDAQDRIVFSSDISYGEISSPFVVEIASPTSVRIGISYDPQSGRLEINDTTLTGNHVLYKESLFRHALFSLPVFLVFIYIGLRLLKSDFPETVYNKTGIDLVACEKVFLFLLILTCLSSWPLFDKSRFLEGDDFYFHLSRIDGMARSLKAGYFPPRILLGWMENYGVGSGFYYPDMLMLIPAGLCMLGVSAIDAFRFFLIFCTFLSLLSIYHSAKNIRGGSRLSGFFAAILYAFAAYRLTCVFYRNALGEVQAFIFYPLIVWGLTDILNGKTEQWKIFALGFFGLLMSHMISLAIAGILCAVTLLFFISRLIRNKQLIFAFAKAAVITILLGAFFLLPMAEQAMKTELEINVFAKRPFEIEIYNLMPFYSIFLPFSPWDQINNNAHAYPGLSLLLVPVLRLFLLKRKEEKLSMKTADRIMLCGLFLLIVGTDLFPWQFFKWLLARIQFTWRFFSPATVLLCIAGGIYSAVFFTFAANKKLAAGLVIFAAMLTGFPMLIHTFNTKLYPVENLRISDKIISGVEYIPSDFFYPFQISERNKVQPSGTDVTIFNSWRRNLGFIFSFEHETESEPMDYSVPLIYYYGYKATLTGENSTEKLIPVTRDNLGLVRVNDEGLQNGTIRVWYAKTRVQIIGETISLVTLTALLFFFLKNKKQTLAGAQK